MDLQTAAVIVALASPAIMAAVGWGTFKARLYAVEQRVTRIEDARERERLALHA